MKSELRHKTFVLAVETLETLPGWQDLDAASRRTVQAETQQLGQSFDGFIRSRLAVGEHFTRIHAVLEPRRMFSRFCEAYNLNRSTANGFIASYANAKKSLPTEVLAVAAARGVNIMGSSSDSRPLGKYTDAVRKLPPPKTQDPQQIVDWLDELETIRKKAKKKAAEVEPDVDELLKDAYRYIVLRLDRVPSRRRRAWLNRLVGMSLAKIGVASSQSFDPEAAPEDFVPVIGRPRSAAEAAA